LNIPLSLLTDRDIVAYLEKGMSISDKASGVLNTAIRTFIKEVLPENSKDVVEKTSATGAIQIYWDRLENHFQQFLLELDDPEKALETWETSVKRTVRESLNACLDGRYRGSARSYKALSAASDYLNARLVKLTE
jgi:siroheme synthase (precorrin-2 oxidase/ferrochelatase)